ncbi:MAG: sulfur carrier protein ThiS [Alloprevotella sp.]
MKVLLNNQEVQTQAQNMSELLSELGYRAEGVAVAVDNRIVPRGTWSDTPLREGCRITVIRAACGG